MHDPYNLVPPDIKANIEAEEMAERHFAQAVPLLMALKDFDPDIVDIKFFGERAEEKYGIKRNRWHIHRKNIPPASDSYIPIETPDGGYREPDSGVLNELRERDLRNGSVWRKFEEAQRSKSPAALQAKEFVDNGEAEEIAFSVRAAKRLAGDGGMNARLWGRG